jgi:hypothetical protein
MIFTEIKEFDEILRSLEGHEKVFLIGCPVCATSWGTGGKQQVAEMAERLASAGKQCVAQMMPSEATCDQRVTRVDLRKQREALEQAEAVLVMSCGAGVQTVASLVELPTYPALNTLFLGRLQRLTLADERCVLCGECILAETGGICPLALCPKGLMNGPCGGYRDGRCEADPEKDCAWVAIYERQRALGQLDRFMRIHPPKDYRPSRHPRVGDKQKVSE